MNGFAKQKKTLMVSPSLTHKILRQTKLEPPVKPVTGIKLLWIIRSDHTTKKREQLGYDPVSEEEIKHNDFYNYYRRKYFWESLIADVIIFGDFDLPHGVGR